MIDLARLLLDELAAADPAVLDGLRELLVLDSTPETPPALVTVNTAAKLLGVSPKTVRRRISVGTLPAVSDQGRTMLRADELDAYIQGLEHVGGVKPVRRRARPKRDYGFLLDPS